PCLTEGLSAKSLRTNFSFFSAGRAEKREAGEESLVSASSASTHSSWPSRAAASRRPSSNSADQSRLCAAAVTISLGGRPLHSLSQAARERAFTIWASQ